jgi:hypothetical protein
MSFTSEAANKERKGRRFLGCFFTVFMLFGLGFSAIFAWPMTEILQARGWRETPCTILTSEVRSHRGSKGGSTYSVEVTYEYVVNEQTYTSSRYKFMTGSSSGYDGKKAVVDRLRPGTKTVCYVDRRNPSEAVIERGFTADLMFALIPLTFVAVGTGGLFVLMVRKGKPKSPHERAAAAGAAPPKGAKGELKASTSPGARLGCAIFLAVFWNGILSFFVVDMVQDWSKGRFDGCATAFMLPFVLVGLGILVFVGYCFLALFNPRPKVRMHGEPTLGETIEVEWEIAGNCDRMTRFSILLEGREEATYRRGTSTTTEKSIFESVELAAITRSKDMRRGKVKASIPAASMHSFKADNNKFVWHLRVEGQIPRWPDVSEEYEIEVKPHRAGGAS